MAWWRGVAAAALCAFAAAAAEQAEWRRWQQKLSISISINVACSHHLAPLYGAQGTRMEGYRAFSWQRLSALFHGG